MRPWEVGLVSLNLVFAAIGFASYAPQFLETPVWLWLFVPDCPLGWLLFAAAYLSSSNALRCMSFAAGIKYSIWTFSAESLYFGSFGSVPAVAAVIAAHIMLITEVFLLKPRFTLKEASLVFAFLGVSDVSDYVIGTYPWLPSPVHLPQLALIAAASTIVVSIVPLIWQTINRRSNEAVV